MKKKIPLIIFEKLHPYVIKNLDIVIIQRDENSLLHLIDIEKGSTFFFKVSKQEVRQGKYHYLTQYLPANKNTLTENSTWFPIETIINVLETWLNLLRTYKEIYTAFDDPILKSNQKRFEKLFDIIDEDVETSSFNLEQQIYLDDYLVSVGEKLKQIQEQAEGEDKKIYSELIEDVITIQKNLTTETKKKIVTRLSRFFAKAQKIGLDLIKEIFVNVAAEFTKRLITGG